MGRSKYSLEFKLEVVGRYLQGDIGSDSLGKELGVLDSDVRDWVRYFEAHGPAGLVRTSNRAYTKEFKLEVLETIERERLSVREAAVRFNIAAKSSILVWRANYEKSGILGLENKPRGKPKTMSQYKRKKKNGDKPPTREEELLERIYYLEAENALLKKLDALTQEQKKRKPSKS